MDPLLDSLPAQEHLKTYSWIFSQKYTDQEKNVQPDVQALYIYARLLEAAGESQAALVKYQQLYDDTRLSDLLTIKTDDAIERLTGQKTKRALQRLERKYVSDPIPVNVNLTEFHAQTLLNFDPVNPGENLEQALDYYLENTALRNKDDAAKQIDVLKQSRDRLRKWLDVKRAEVKRLGYTKGYSKTVESNAYRQYYHIWELLGFYLVEAQFPDEAISELSQLKGQVSVVSDNVYFQLARAHCQRLELNNDKSQKKLTNQQRLDVEQALLNLENYIDAKLRYGGALNWLEVKKDPYLGTVRVTRRFKELFAGRL
jgi:hypothetical protein